MPPAESSPSRRLPTPAKTAAPFADIDDAALPTLTALRASIGFDLWMMTRVTNNDLVVQAIVDRYYGLKVGDVLSWNDSLCKQMHAGMGPRIAPATRNVPAFVDAGVSETYPIAAYIGIPIVTGNGDFIGTLCAFNPVAMDEDVMRHEALVEASARMLATLLDRARSSVDQPRHAELAEAKRYIGHETGVQTEPGWHELLTGEEIRCEAVGDTIGVLVVSLDDLRDIRVRVGRPANDWTLRRGIEIIRIHLPKDSIVARIGATQIAAIISSPQGEETLRATLNSLHAGLNDSRIKHSMGFKIRDPRGGLLEAWREATENLRQPISELVAPRGA